MVDTKLDFMFKIVSDEVIENIWKNHCPCPKYDDFDFHIELVAFDNQLKILFSIKNRGSENCFCTHSIHWILYCESD